MPPKPKSAIRHTTIVGGPAPDAPIIDAEIIAEPPSDSKPNSKAQPVTPDPVAPGYRPGHIAKGLTNVYIQIGSIVKLFDPISGGALIANAKKCAESLDQLAKENASVRRALEAMLSTNAWIAVAIAHAPLFMATPYVRNNMMRAFGSMVAEDVTPENLANAFFNPDDIPTPNIDAWK